MKRIHLFEFEDFHWFPNWIRNAMTKLIIVMHGLLKTDEEITKLLAPLLKETNSDHIIDLCSGSGGPMIKVHEKLKANHSNLGLTLTDLYPDLSAAKTINADDDLVSYRTEPVDATNVDDNLVGLRTMICSFHHMNPTNAKQILKSAHDDKQPICVFEISDNSTPTLIWWLAFPINIIMCLFVTPFVRPFTWQQFVFTYLIPIIPICFAWDGAVSNARTYTIKDMDILLEDLRSTDYVWETNTIPGKAKKLYLIGKPV